MPGHLTHFDATSLHPKGKIRVQYQRTPTGTKFVIDTPVPGTLAFEGKTQKLAAGTATFSFQN